MRYLRCSALTGALLSFALTACSSTPGSGSPQQLADTVTRAVYRNDLDTTIGTFDEATKRDITRAQLGELSDRMHALGELKSIVQRNGNADTGRYEFDASFTGGMMLVQIRIDRSGRIAAYRVIPEEISPPTPSTKG
ncbi:MAG: hypothetical protein NVSMB19_13690 [Vulcanimicrobiaceae bacterium]